MIWASRWSVALRTFYRQILSVLYSSFPFGNFRPRLVRALLVKYIYHTLPCYTSWKKLINRSIHHPPLIPSLRYSSSLQPLRSRPHQRSSSRNNDGSGKHGGRKGHKWISSPVKGVEIVCVCFTSSTF